MFQASFTPPSFVLEHGIVFVCTVGSIQYLTRSTEAGALRILPRYVCTNLQGTRTPWKLDLPVAGLQTTSIQSHELAWTFPRYGHGQSNS